MSKDNTINKTPNASEIVANKCIALICEDMASEYGYYFITDDNNRNKWCELLEYRDDANQYAINSARVKLMTVVGNDSKATNPAFLETVLTKIAKHLVKYTMKNPIYFNEQTIETDADSKQVKNAKRAIRRTLALQYLHEKLITENKYLISIREKHNHRPHTRTATAERRKKHIEQALKTRREINSIFQEEGCPKRFKKR